MLVSLVVLQHSHFLFMLITTYICSHIFNFTQIRMRGICIIFMFVTIFAKGASNSMDLEYCTLTIKNIQCCNFLHLLCAYGCQLDVWKSPFCTSSHILISLRHVVYILMLLIIIHLYGWVAVWYTVVFLKARCTIDFFIDQKCINIQFIAFQGKEII